MSPKLGPDKVKVLGMTMPRSATALARDTLLILLCVAVLCFAAYVVFRG